jgi:hypothetical protein
MIRSNLGAKDEGILDEKKADRRGDGDRAALLTRDAMGKAGIRRQASVGVEDLRGLKS